MPVIVASLSLGILAGALTALAAGMLVGPLMPLNVELGLAQPLENTLYRAGFFLLVAIVSGGMAEVSRRRFALLRDARNELSERRLLTPGRRESLDFESRLRMVSRRFRAGSRVVIVLSVVKNPQQQINYGTGGDVSDESITDAAEPLVIRWLPGSYVELPIRRLTRELRGGLGVAIRLVRARPLDCLDSEM